nr:chemokine-like protein TAFA-5 isoform X3 [Peromyscus maniculatus bairdii]
MQLLKALWALAGAALCCFLVLVIHAQFLKEGQLAAGTCEIVTLDRDSSQPRRTIARQTARCACRKGQIAGTTRARPACVDGLLTIAAPAVPLGVAVAPWRLYTSAAALHPSWTPPVLHLPTVSQRPDKDSPIPRSPELKSVQLNPGGQDSDTQGVVPGISNTWYVEPGRTHPP